MIPFPPFAFLCERIYIPGGKGDVMAIINMKPAPKAAYLGLVVVFAILILLAFLRLTGTF